MKTSAEGSSGQSLLPQLGHSLGLAVLLLSIHFPLACTLVWSQLFLWPSFLVVSGTLALTMTFARPGTLAPAPAMVGTLALAPPFAVVGTLTAAPTFAMEGTLARALTFATLRTLTLALISVTLKTLVLILIYGLGGTTAPAPTPLSTGTPVPALTSLRMETLALTSTSAGVVGTLTLAPISALVDSLALAVTTLAFTNNNS